MSPDNITHLKKHSASQFGRQALGSVGVPCWPGFGNVTVAFASHFKLWKCCCGIRVGNLPNVAVASRFRLWHSLWKFALEMFLWLPASGFGNLPNVAVAFALEMLLP